MMHGRIIGIARAEDLLQEQDPARGYYPKPSKSIFVAKVDAKAADCRVRLEGYDFQFCDGYRYTGGFHWRMKHSDGVPYLSSCPEIRHFFTVRAVSE
jgi:hypothetical protein